ncbi:MAG TPA: DUF2550 domain-containing protein [Actinocrinis sp.]|jgi:hypothetical protein
MTAALTDLLEILAVLCLAFVCAIGVLFARRVTIRRRGGTFDCSLRLTPLPDAPRGLARQGEARAAVRSGAGGAGPAGTGGGGGAEAESRIVAPAERGTRVPWSASGVRAGRGWSYGIAQYENDRIDWYRIFSYAYRPAAVLTRRDLEVVSRREAVDGEELALFPGWTIVECRFGSGLVELAMAPDALTGFLSWLEAAPPGQDVNRVA